MRIAHVVQRFDPALGGTESHVLHVAREQAARGHDVTVFTSAHAGSPMEETRPDAVRVRRFRARQRFGDYLLPPWLPMRGLADALAAHEPDVLHAHAYRFATIEEAARAARRTGVPLVVTAHGFYPPENALVALARWRYDRFRGRAALAAAARCVAVTEHEVAHYEALGVPAARVDVVPNGVPPAAFAPGDGARFRARHGLNGEVVLFLARLAHDKGLGDLIAAAPRLLDARPGATVVVAGRDAGAEAAARRRAERLGVAERVRFVGAVDDPRDAYAACDVFVLPSWYEAFGIVLLEAMAQGRPVVATTAGGMPEVVGDAGVVVPPRDPPALADALTGLLADAPRRAELAQRGRERAERFLWSRVVDRLEETYERARRR